MRTSKLFSEDKIQVTLDTLESKSFHIRCLKKYLVKRNVRQHQVIEVFFFCSPEQIEMAQRFVSSFVIQTNAIFNTNELNMPLSILVGITNTMASFQWPIHLYILSLQKPSTLLMPSVKNSSFGIIVLDLLLCWEIFHLACQQQWLRTLVYQ